MRSYTFNSESGLFERTVPAHRWGYIACMVIVLVLAATIAWEKHWRSQGYVPADFDATLNMWAEHRTKADKAGPETTVIIGSSRALFDIDLPTWRQTTGNPHLLQLAIEGASPLPVFRDIVENSRFAGTMVVSVAPDLFFAKFAMEENRAMKRVKHYQNWSPAQKMEHGTALLTEPFLAFVDDNLMLSSLLLELPLKNRDDAQLKPWRVPKLGVYTRERQARMWSKLDTDTLYRNRFRFLWLGFNSLKGERMTPQAYAESTAKTQNGAFEPYPPPMLWTDAERDTFFNTIAGWVNTFRARGGKIIFIRPPSSDTYYLLENFNHPREKTWDKLLEKTGVPGIHFEDYPELQGYNIPEWSHLHASEVAKFTQALAKIFMKKMDSDFQPQ